MMETEGAELIDYPLTHAQQRVWYAEMTYPGTCAENFVYTIRWKADIDFTLLTRALNQVIAQNDGLRLRIREQDFEIKQYLMEYQARRFDFFDFSGNGGPEKFGEWIEAELRSPLLLMDTDLFYFGLVKFGPGESGFFIKIHHLITDGWSMGLIIHQAVKCYEDLKNGAALPAENHASYLDYIQAEAEYLKSKVFARNRQYWDDTFRTIPEAATLRYYHLQFSQNPENARSARRAYPISAGLAARIYQFTEEHDISIFGLFLAAVYQYMVLVTSETDVIIGTITHNRYNPKENNMVGMFVNTAAIRINAGNDQSFLSLLKAINGQLLPVFMNQKYPFDLLMRDLRERNRWLELPNLFDTVLSYQRVQYDRQIKREFHYNGMEENPMRVYVEDVEGERLELVLQYRSSLFTASEIDDFSRQLFNLLAWAMDHPSAKLSWAHLLSGEEQRALSCDGITHENPGDNGIEAVAVRQFGEKVTAALTQIAEVFENNDCARPRPLTIPELRKYWTAQFPDFQLPAYYLRQNKACLGLLAKRKLREMESGADISTVRENTPDQANAIQVAVAATFTSEPIGDYISWWGKQFGENFQVQFASYNQVFQELLEPNSLLSTNTGVNLLLVRFEDWLRNDPSGDNLKCEKLERNLAELSAALGNVPQKIPYFVGIFPVSTHPLLSESIRKRLAELNDRWKKTLTGFENVYPIDFSGLARLYNIVEVFDAAKDQEGHLPFTDEYYAAMGTFIARKIYSRQKQWFKVLVLDADHTLWQGICGEDGPLGVSVTGPYRELQQFMLNKMDEGMVLAICSKNNEADLWQVFAQNPGMILRKEHFAAWRINWGAKSENLRELASELNLGLDSFIFIDDSAMECSEVMANLPQVLTLRLPEDPEQIPLFLEHAWAFDRFKITAEDQQRNQMYQAERMRRETRAEGLSLADYLGGLELKVSMMVMDKSQLPRVAQLTQRTNQFNLNAIRRTEAEIERLITAQKAVCWTIEVADRFGDYGLVGVVITREENTKLFLDTFLLSCRVLGRGVENAILSLLKRYCQGMNLESLEAAFYPTDKNQPFHEFITKTGWQKIAGGKDHTRFQLSVDEISDTVEYIDCYYQRAYPKAEPQEFNTPKTSTDLINENIVDKSVSGNHHWQVQVVNEENLVHKNHLLPLQNYSGELLLQLPVGEGKEPGVEQAVYVAPRTEMEAKLVEIWQKVLGISPIGVNDSFLELGGDSFKAVQIITRLRPLKLFVSIMDVFRHQSIADLLQNAGASPTPVDKTGESA
jgi:FkbH-like protein